MLETYEMWIPTIGYWCNMFGELDDCLEKEDPLPAGLRNGMDLLHNPGAELDVPPCCKNLGWDHHCIVTYKGRFYIDLIAEYEYDPTDPWAGKFADSRELAAAARENAKRMADQRPEHDLIFGRNTLHLPSYVKPDGKMVARAAHELHLLFPCDEGTLRGSMTQAFLELREATFWFDKNCYNFEPSKD